MSTFSPMPGHAVAKETATHAEAKNVPARKPGFVNGPLLRFARWASDSVINVPPQNRFFSALGLSSGLFAGYRIMRAATGRDFNGTEFIPGGLAAKAGLAGLAPDAQQAFGAQLKSQLNPVLRPLYGIFRFEYSSRDPRDLLKRSIMWLAPAVLGFAGVLIGSNFAFRKQKKAIANPEFIEDYSAKIAMTQSDRWGYLSGLSALFGSSAGLYNFPSPLNYGMNLATRSTLGYDKRVDLPLIGKFWSNNKSSYYQGLKGLLEYTCLYASRNPSPEPVELRPLAQAILTPHFPNATEAQVEGFVRIIQHIRAPYVSADGISPDKQAILSKRLHGVLRGEGFERTLCSLGLNPTEAIFNNGFSEKVSNALGTRKKTDQLKQEFRAKAAARIVARARGDYTPGAVEDAPGTAPESPAPLPEKPDIAPSSTFREKVGAQGGRLADLRAFTPPANHIDAVSAHASAAAQPRNL